VSFNALFLDEMTYAGVNVVLLKLVLILHPHFQSISLFKAAVNQICFCIFDPYPKLLPPRLFKISTFNIFLRLFMGYCRNEHVGFVLLSVFLHQVYDKSGRA